MFIERILGEDQSLTFRKTTRIHVDFLKLGGIVKFDGKTLDFFGTHLLALYTHLCHLLISAMYVWSFIMKARQSQYSVEHIAETVGILGVHSRFIILFLHRRKLSSMLELSEKLWSNSSPSEKETIHYFVKKSSLLCCCYVGFCSMMCFMYLMVSQMALTSDDESETRKLPYVFFAEVQKTPWYEIVCAVQSFSMLSIGVTCAGVDTAATFLIMMTCGFFRSLQVRLANISEFVGKGSKKVETMILDCVRYHQIILK